MQESLETLTRKYPHLAIVSRYPDAELERLRKYHQAKNNTLCVALVNHVIGVRHANAA